ncbi:MAG TPA: hydroxysqualene dehydroxylase HpnE [Geminicoccaceae bacterium]|nr:hydroxysqualene dehydroxylase HpnE [Geminicoccaceae bacterium]
MHVVGAGLAGLACAVRLATEGREVCLYEATGAAGGRCRSWFEAALGRTIDNGNHLLLSANEATLGYLGTIGSRDSLVGPDGAVFPFVDLTTGARWTVRPNDGPLPWWIFSATRRVPGTRARDYLAAWRLAAAGATATVADRLDPAGPLWNPFWRPLTTAVLNTAPEEASARLLWSAFGRSFARGGAGCRPLVVRESLSASFVEPALGFLRHHGATMRFRERVRELSFSDGRVDRLAGADGRVALDRDDWLVLAVPPAIAAGLVPGLPTPRESRAIVNAHFRLGAPPARHDGAPFLGVIGGTAEWLFFRDDLVSVTVSAADALAEWAVEEIAAVLWTDVARALELDVTARPPVRVIKERRATFAQTPEALAHRPPTRTPYGNLLLAGDWTATGLPATIEGAVRSGRAAARAIGAARKTIRHAVFTRRASVR